MATPDQAHLPDFCFGDPLSVQIGGATVRGMDHYQLFGRHARGAVRQQVNSNYVVSDRAERGFLFHEKTTRLQAAANAPIPTSNAPALDALVAHRLSIPLWERAYKIEGRILINPKRKRVTVDGRLFKPAGREMDVSSQNVYRYGLDWTRARMGRMKTVDRAIWLTHPYWQVYFHNFNDLMSQVVMADALGLDRDIPIVIDEAWAKSKFGRFFLATSLLRDREIIVLAREDKLRCRTLYMLQPQYFCRAYLDQVAAACPEKEPDHPVSDRLVLVRREHVYYERPCNGIEVLADALVSEGYTALDPATLSISEQKWVFSRARHIVSENGSALTNILFRAGRPLRIDALMASTFPSPTFQCMSKVYGFHYHAHVLPSRRLGDVFQSELTPDVVRHVLGNAHEFQKETI